MNGDQLTADIVTAFLVEASVQRYGSHAGGTLEKAESLLAAHPSLAAANIYTAAVLGDEAMVKHFLLANPVLVTQKGGPYEWDALTCLCFSRYLRFDKKRSDGFVAAAKTLLDAGASANTGWTEAGHQPMPEWESVLYGAAGIAHHAALTKLLLDYGADPNDNETVYHTPEYYDNDALKVLVGTGKITAENLMLMLVRKHDWHDYDGVKWLLEQGADPNAQRKWGGSMHHAVLRDNDPEIIQLLLDHGGDPRMLFRGQSVTSIAARRGRGDLLQLFEQKGFADNLQGADALLAACAKHDTNAIDTLLKNEPRVLPVMLSEGGRWLANFAGVGNTKGVGLLLDLGVPVTALFKEGDAYFEEAANSMALHVAAWRGWHSTVALLIGRGAPVNVTDGNGNTPLVLAIRACTDSYWRYRRKPDSIRALLQAGASLQSVSYPTGYEEADELIRSYLPTHGKTDPGKPA